MRTTTLSVPGISRDTCKSAIEETIGPATGVNTAEADIAAKTVLLESDDRLRAADLADLIKEQGYDVAGFRQTTEGEGQ